MSETTVRCLVRGSINIDEFFHVKNIVRPGETISSTHLEQRAGGKGANQAVAVAKAGGAVDMVGAVGEDGLWVVEQLRQSAVGVEGINTAKEPTGRAIIQLTEDGENCIILHKGANYALVPFPALESSDPIPSVTHLLLQNEIPLLTTTRAAASAHDKGIATVFNPSPMPSAAELAEVQFPWNKIDWLLVNEGELEGLLDLFGASSNIESDVPPPAIFLEKAELAKAYKLVKTLSASSVIGKKANIVCTLGPLGVIARVSHLPDMLYIPALKLQGDVRDTTGAGDCFTGYLVAGLMQLRARGLGLGEKADVEAVLRRSVKAAGMCVERRGAMESIPTSSEVDARI